VIEAQDPTVTGLLGELEAAVASHRDLPDEARADLAERVAALRGSLDRERTADDEERHRLGHDLRAQLNAIAGWTHILRMDGTTPATIGRATEVFDRSVRTLTGLIEAYTTARDR
jgi:light-regulated signal transduction histidine kinase (bacteriophytochrome)